QGAGMRVRMLGVATIVVLLSTAGWAAVPENETKSTTAHPRAPATPPAPPDAATMPDRPGVLDQGPNDETSGVGQDINVPAGTTHDGDISCVYGHVTIDGHVNGDVTVVAGRLDLNGSVDGDVTGVASRMDLDPKAKVDGGVTNVPGA